MSEHGSTVEATDQTSTQPVKCVVWDLDNTIWHGVLLEDADVSLIPGVVEVIKTLDSRGILNSIASRNDHETAMEKLAYFGLKEYFLHPQINWNSKASSIKEIARLINIGLDTFAFVDDQPFEREEVAFVLPEVRCIDACAVDQMLDMPALNPRFITEDSKLRRLMYLSDIQRHQAEQTFVGSNEAFLATLDMTFTIAVAQEDDLQRAEELTMRTHQLNTTGYTYSYDELNAFRQSDKHKLFVASLVDRYGTYGKIGLALIECEQAVWTIKLLLMSCRVMSRGVGTIMINHIMNLAKQAGVRLQAEFISNNRNRMMYIAYKFGGFQEVAKVGDLVILENDLTHIQAFPDYINVQIVD
jgi:FkbH-like protein